MRSLWFSPRQALHYLKFGRKVTEPKCLRIKLGPS